MRGQWKIRHRPCLCFGGEPKMTEEEGLPVAVAPCFRGRKPRFAGSRRTALRIPYLEKMAEEEGFEPPRPFGPHDFESCAFNHSAIPPCVETRSQKLFTSSHRRKSFQRLIFS